jgi:stage V sporulation protein SpoVS
MAAAEDLPYALKLSGADPAAVTSALGSAAVALARDPAATVQALGELTLAQLAVAVDVARGVFDGEPEIEGADRRFSDRAWRGNPLLRGVLGSYLATSRWAHRTLDSLDLDEQTKQKARFGLGLLLDAAAPTNVAWLNPEVV